MSDCNHSSQVYLEEVIAKKNASIAELEAENAELKQQLAELREALECLRGECTNVDGDPEDYIEALKKADETLLEVKK